MFRDFPFLCVIGDEAQHLKNRRTQNAKATASLNSEGRMLLTGTPIENSVSDLLSLLAFLLPGATPAFRKDHVEMKEFGTNNVYSNKQPPTS